MTKKGFTLIEIVAVIIVIGIASLGLVGVIHQVLIDVHRPHTLTTATALAEGEAERVMGLSFANVVDENRGSPASYSGNFSNYSWEVRVDSLDSAAPSLGSDADMSDYKVVEVRVHHAAVGHVSLTFLRTHY